MAISFVGTTGFDASTGALNLTLPAGAQVGHFLLMFLSTANQASSSPGVACGGLLTSATNGYVGTGSGGSAGAVDLWVGYKTITSLVSISTGDYGSYQAGVGVVLSGVDPTNPIAQAANRVDAAATSTPTFPSPGSPTSGQWVIHAIGLDRDANNAAYDVFSTTPGHALSDFIVNLLTGLTDDDIGAIVNAGTGGGLWACAYDDSHAGFSGGTFTDSTTHAYVAIRLNPAPVTQEGIANLSSSSTLSAAANLDQLGVASLTSTSSLTTSAAIGPVPWIVEYASTDDPNAVKTTTLTSTPQAGDVVLAITTTNDPTTLESVSGLGAAWSEPVGVSSANSHWYSIGTGATASGVVTATTNVIESGRVHVLLIRDLGAAVSAAFGTRDGSPDFLQGPSQVAAADTMVVTVASRANSSITFPSTVSPGSGWQYLPPGTGFTHAAQVLAAFPLEEATHSVGGNLGLFVNKRISQLVLTVVVVQQGVASFTSTSTLSAAAEVEVVGVAALTTVSTLGAAGEVQTPVQTHEGAAALTSASSLSVGAAATRHGVAELSSSSTLATAAIRSTDAAVALTSASVLTAAGEASTPSATHEGAAALSSSSTLAAAAGVDKVALADLVASSTLTTAAVVTKVAAAVLTSTSTLVAGATYGGAALVDLTSTSALSATAFGIVVHSGVVALSASSVLSAAAVPARLAAVALAVSSTLGVAGTPARLAAVSLVSSATLNATADVTAVASVTLLSSSTLSSSAVRTAVVAVALTSSSALSATGTGLGEQAGAAALTSSSVLMGEVRVTRFPTVALVSTAVLFADSSGGLAGQVSLSSSSTLAVSGVIEIVATAILESLSGLAVSAERGAQVAAALTAYSILQAEAHGQAFGLVDLTSMSELEVAGLAQAYAAATFVSISTLALVAATFPLYTPIEAFATFQQNSVTTALFVQARALRYGSFWYRQTFPEFVQD